MFQTYNKVSFTKHALKKCSTKKNIKKEKPVLELVFYKLYDTDYLLEVILTMIYSHLTFLMHFSFAAIDKLKKRNF